MKRTLAKFWTYLMTQPFSRAIRSLLIIFAAVSLTLLLNNKVGVIDRLEVMKFFNIVALAFFIIAVAVFIIKFLTTDLEIYSDLKQKVRSNDKEIDPDEKLGTLADDYKEYIRSSIEDDIKERWEELTQKEAIRYEVRPIGKRD